MTNRTVFVTGAGRDIGLQIAERLGKDNGFVVFHYSASRQGAEQALERLIQRGGSGTLVQSDLRDTDAASILADKVVEALDGRTLDVFVSNSAIAAASPLGQTLRTNIQAMTLVNLLSPFELINKLSGHMSDGGSIVALSVAATQRIFSADFSYFSATKAAMDCLVRHWATALGSRGIRVNSVAPGVIEANFRRELLKNTEFRRGLEMATALSRIGQIEDVVDVVEFLASPGSRWITGQVIDVSGGWKL